MRTTQPPPEQPALDEPSTASLVREALDEVKELARVEIELARSDVELELARAKRAAIGIGIALAAGVLVLSLLALALVLALGGTATIALAIAGASFMLGGLAAVLGYSTLPKRPLERTREHLKREVGQLKERVA